MIHRSDFISRQLRENCLHIINSLKRSKRYPERLYFLYFLIWRLSFVTMSTLQRGLKLCTCTSELVHIVCYVLVYYIVLYLDSHLYSILHAMYVVLLLFFLKAPYFSKYYLFELEIVPSSPS